MIAFSGQNLPEEAELFLSSSLGRSASTKKLYRTVLSLFFRCSEKDPKNLNSQDVQVFLRYLGENVYTKNTLRAYINVMRSFFRFTKQEDLRKDLGSIRPPKTLPFVPTAKEIEAMINCAQSLRNKVTIQTLARTGMRLGELVNLSIEDLDLSNRRIVIRSGGEWTPKGGKERIVRMDPETAALLKKFIGSRKEGKLFDVTSGTIRSMVKTIANKAGIKNAEKMTPHKLRHFFSCDFLQRGGDIRSLQTLLGHSDLKTTCIYLSYNFETVSSAYDKAFGDKETKKED